MKAGSRLQKYTLMFREKVCSLPEKLSKTEKSSSFGASLPDYSVCRLSGKQKAAYYGAALGCLAMLGLLFYRSVFAAAALCVLALPLEQVYRSMLAEKRRSALAEGFKDVLYTISGAAASGRQMPSALELAASSAANSAGEHSDICRELTHICTCYRQSHADIGEMLRSFGERSHVAEIRQFAAAYTTCQLCGGDLEEVCRKSASLILDKMSLEEEARSLISQKKIDVILLTAMPPGVLLFLNLANYSYVSVLYETGIGRVVMTLCLLLIISALLWGVKIINIKL